MKITKTATSNPAGSPRSTPIAAPPGGDFDRFAHLTGKLVRLPKTELDQQRRRAGA